MMEAPPPQCLLLLFIKVASIEKTSARYLKTFLRKFVAFLGGVNEVNGFGGRRDRSAGVVLGTQAWQLVS